MDVHPPKNGIFIGIFIHTQIRKKLPFDGADGAPVFIPEFCYPNWMTFLIRRAQGFEVMFFFR